jgi:hypothetical protein
MNKNSRPKQVYLVLNVAQIRKLLEAAVNDCQKNSLHPGKTKERHCVVIEAELSGPEHDSCGSAQVVADSFMESASRYMRE